MSNKIIEPWELLVEVEGHIQAEILRGLLEAQEIEVELDQEGAGRSAFPVTFGILGTVRVSVPAHDLERARQILAEYESGAYSEIEFPAEATQNPEGSDQDSDHAAQG
jgi:hypothetical protein